MNFNTLYKKIAEIDGVLKEERDQDWDEDPMDEPEQIDDFELDGEDEFSDEEIPFDECGMSPIAKSPDQPDNVSMNVNMTGSGAGGIRDLLDVLKNIEEPGDDTPSRGVKLFGRDSQDQVIDEKQGIEYPLDAVLTKGNDLHGKGGPEPRRPAGGGNPYRKFDESLINRLSSLYTEVKNR